MTGDMIDAAVPVREEDSLPLESLLPWLRDAVPGLTGEPTVAQFPGGASNKTYLLSFPGRELVLRTPPKGTKAAGSHDMGREARVISALQGRFPVPPVVAECTDAGVIGQPFYVMDRVVGLILRADPPDGLAITPDLAGALAESMISLLAKLHALDPGELAVMDKGPGYVARQVEGWNLRYRDARTDDALDGERVMQWLYAHQPDDVRRCLIHNDWRFDNLILDPADPTRVLAVLDWEMATVGDPLMDLGGSLAYWVQADDPPELLAFRRQPTQLPGMPTRAEVWRRYCELAGLDAPDFTFYEVFGLFRLAVIAQQIYRRYAIGQAKNPALAMFGTGAQVLVRRCEQLLG